MGWRYTICRRMVFAVLSVAALIVACAFAPTASAHDAVPHAPIVATQFHHPVISPGTPGPFPCDCGPGICCDSAAPCSNCTAMVIGLDRTPPVLTEKRISLGSVSRLVSGTAPGPADRPPRRFL